MEIESLKILYVEEDEELQNTMQMLLEYNVKNLYLAKDGSQALDIYKKKKPDLIITNTALEKLNGIEFIKIIRQNDHNTKIIILTQDTTVKTLLEATELRLTKYLVFPTLGETIDKALQQVLNELKSFSVIEHNILNLTQGYSWNFEKETLQKGLENIHLTQNETKLLNYIFSNPTIVITYEMIIYDIWNDFELTSIETIKTTIKNIRKKLPKNIVKNVYGMGYKLNLENI